MDKVVKTYRTTTTSHNNNNIHHHHHHHNGSTSGWDVWAGSVKTGGADEAACKATEVGVAAASTGCSSVVMEMLVWLSGCSVSPSDGEENSCKGNFISFCSATCTGGVTRVSEKSGLGIFATDFWAAAGASANIWFVGSGGSCSGGSSVAASG